MSDTNDILDSLFSRKTWLALEGFDDLCVEVQGAIIEIIRLRAEVAALKAERDEARRELCRVIGYQRQDRFDATAIAAERGWDCYKEGGGA